MGSGDESVVGATGEPESSLQLREVGLEDKREVNLSYFISARPCAVPLVFSSLC